MKVILNTVVIPLKKYKKLWVQPRRYYIIMAGLYRSFVREIVVTKVNKYLANA